MDALNDFILQAAASPWLPLVMLAAAIVDGFFPPVPSETVLVGAVAAAAAAGAWPTVIAVCLVAGIGAVIGDNLAYAIGRAAGTRRFAWMRRPAAAAAALERAQRTLGERGAPFILGARYIPVGRVAVNLAAGALRYPRRRFVPLTVLGGFAWAAYCTAIALLAGAWLAGNPLASAALGVVLALLIGVVLDRLAARRRRRAEAAAAAAQRAIGRPAAVDEALVPSVSARL